jgi:hypothetical protein
MTPKEKEIIDWMFWVDYEWEQKGEFLQSIKVLEED